MAVLRVVALVHHHAVQVVHVVVTRRFLVLVFLLVLVLAVLCSIVGGGCRSSRLRRPSGPRSHINVEREIELALVLLWHERSGAKLLHAEALDVHAEDGGELADARVLLRGPALVALRAAVLFRAERLRGRERLQALVERRDRDLEIFSRSSLLLLFHLLLEI